MSSAELVLVVALGIAAMFVFVWYFYRRMMRKAAALWEPNTRLVQGTFSRWRIKLTGTYQGRPMLAYLAKESAEDDARETYRYVVRITIAPGFENWSAWFVPERKGAPGAWHLKAGTRAAEQLRAAGLMQALEPAHQGYRCSYRAGAGRMQFSAPGAGMYYCPDVQSFQGQLDLLARLAAITQAAAGAGVRQAA